MIVVIADDLTGAVELGGIGIRHGLKVQVSLDSDVSASTDLLILATDTRAKTEQQAIDETVKLCAKLGKIKPDLVFKKIDSVLRGHILPEVRAQLAVSGIKRALLIPANPAFERTIENGHYLIHGVPIHQTGFKDDPEFPALGSRIPELLRSSGSDVYTAAAGKPLRDGVTVAEVARTADLDAWLDQAGADTLIGGGAAFFEVLLNSLTDSSTGEKSEHPLMGNCLYVSGTAYPESVTRISSVPEREIVAYLPDLIYQTEANPAELEKWLSEMTSRLSTNRSLIIAIDPESRKGKTISAAELRERTAFLVKELFSRSTVDELLIEGGSTASSVLRALGVKTLCPVAEFAPGVVRSRAPDRHNLHVTLKPGSYKWSPPVWPF